jgi:hypothetical protein
LKGKGSNETPSNNGACNTAKPLPKMKTKMGQTLT